MIWRQTRTWIKLLAFLLCPERRINAGYAVAVAAMAHRLNDQTL